MVMDDNGKGKRMTKRWILIYLVAFGTIRQLACIVGGGPLGYFSWSLKVLLGASLDASGRTSLGRLGGPWGLLGASRGRWGGDLGGVLEFLAERLQCPFESPLLGPSLGLLGLLGGL